MHMDSKLGVDFQSVQPDVCSGISNLDNDYILHALDQNGVGVNGFMQDYDSEMHESFFRKRKRKNEVKNSEYEQ